ncbi:MAG: SUMF1/EgtB/PvdO family nonheme iron enzyme [Planctomycetes bacterium]|nr:SUMF1/EgtB/PvdO family nonheme iron enzyme [Planctomycetota bacterium]
MSSEPLPRSEPRPPSPGSASAPHVVAPRVRELFRELAESLERGDGDPEAFFARHPDAARELRELHAAWLRAQSLLGELGADARLVDSALDSIARSAVQDDDAARARLEHLEDLRPQRSRYELLERVGQGGMGVVHRVRDVALGRELAMKRIRADRGGSARIVRRFLAEARILGRLDHPGVVPVHELGVDEHGSVFFTMPLVRGQSLTEVFELAWSAREGWTEARVLEVLLRVCDTIAFAHAQGVVHRDLKPGNVMVGRFGETYVMDWGLARREWAADARNLDLADSDAQEPDAPPTHAEGDRQRTVVDPTPASKRGEPRAGTPSSTDTGAELDERNRAAGGPDGRIEDSFSPANTLEGEVLGTPSYMAPEQARGERDAIGPPLDVYSIGAILYHFLARRAPYAQPGASEKSREVLELVRVKAPERLATLVPHAPVELVAICERAMERDAAERYEGVAKLADDLRAYVEGRVVRAHEQGAWAELNKWIRRNRRLALASGVALLALVGGLVAVIVVRSIGAAQTRMEADFRGPAALAARAEELWPAREELVPAMERWLAEARELVRRRDAYAHDLAELRARGTPLPEEAPEAISARRQTRARIFELEYDALGVEDDRKQIAEHAGQLGWAEGNAEWDARLARNAQAIQRERRALELPAGWSYADPDDRRLDAALPRLLAELDELASPIPHGATIAAIEARLDRARSGAHRTLVAGASAWQSAIASIANRDECPLYGGLQIEPQRGLLPLERDPRSGLWEFWLPDTGERPERGTDGTWSIRPETSLVFVLVPGGTAWIGYNELHPWFPDSPADPDPDRTHPRVRLDAFFLSKYEVTQAQWRRWTGVNPSYYVPGKSMDAGVSNSLHPVERVTWTEAQTWLGRFELALPTEAQWSHAAHAGRNWAWPGGETPESLIGRENYLETDTLLNHPDGFVASSPVGHFEPTPWGFHDLGGNVSEWMQDSFWTWYRWPFRDGDGLQQAPDSGHRSVRGGSFQLTHDELRTHMRFERMPDTRSDAYGIRPARGITTD